MTPPKASPIILNADQEHGGLRATVLLIVLVGFVVSFIVFDGILAGQRFAGTLLSSYSFPLSCVLALVFALAAAAAGEALMKRYWPSGRRVVIDDDGIEARLSDGEVVNLDWSRRVWAVNWYFSLRGYPRGGRERRLTAQHFCLASQLQQDDERIVIFGYLRGEAAEALLDDDDFYEIKPADFYEKSRLRRWRRGTDRPEVPNKVLTGKEGPYWLAEQRRWANGIELTSKDFVEFWHAIRDKVDS